MSIKDATWTKLTRLYPLPFIVFIIKPINIIHTNMCFLHDLFNHNVFWTVPRHSLTLTEFMSLYGHNLNNFSASTTIDF